ncbi:hypothetical protein LLG95_10580 [bacterium]|nr:hypothetical protein [bacterium]
MIRWLPWKWFVRRLARRHAFQDPLVLLGYLDRFSQESEVAQPIELLRAGAAFHARGLVNSKAIQHNLDWVWPYWVERQFDPLDPAFIPRAFSITHINLTHRNWTAVGQPCCPLLPIVDPRGLLTPIEDGWSLDAWVIADSGDKLYPSRLCGGDQELVLDPNLLVRTISTHCGLKLASEISVEPRQGGPVCLMNLAARADKPGWLVLSVRPFNPEGISFVDTIRMDSAGPGWLINDEYRVRLSLPFERHRFSRYHDGDVSFVLPEGDQLREIECDVGMATAASMYRLEPGVERNLRAEIELKRYTPDRAGSKGRHVTCDIRPDAWHRALAGSCRLEHPDPLVQRLYDAAVRTLVLLSPGDVFPGPYTYKRFWFRDAVFIMHAMACAGLLERVERTLDRFPGRQTTFGYFHSQNGEWDSNGQALWMFARYCELSGAEPKQAWRNAIASGARWIHRKLTSTKLHAPHAGLMPAGFSAEHLGPNDFYYWDDFWSAGGLFAAARLMANAGDIDAARLMHEQAEALMKSIDASLEYARSRLNRPAIPASPYRRLDAGAIGSIAAGYPLKLWAPDDPRLLDLVDFLIERCFLDGAFFQDMIHSGYNAYLTLHVAQVLLRAGDARFFDALQSVADLASPTGQWPEAIHPHTRGGCMGDGQHAWAAAEWIMMLRNCFVREEEQQGRLIIGSGIVPQWLEKGQTLRFGPAPTTWGTISVQIEPGENGTRVSWQANWRGEPPTIEIRLPNHAPQIAPPGENSVVANTR